MAVLRVCSDNERRVLIIMTTKRQPHRKGGGRSERRISVRAVRRNPPDLKKLSAALIALAMAQAEAEAAAQREADAYRERRDGGWRSA
jgi:branched-subunit amino acid aminotransferase/4-amino-4-deoxychorismate lyase